MKQHPSNLELFRILVLGYGHKEVKNRRDLKESLGEAARKAQIDANCKQEVPKTTEIKGEQVS